MISGGPGSSSAPPPLKLGFDILPKLWLDTRMTNTAAAAAIRTFAAEVATRLPNGHTGAGEPSRRARKIIAGELFEVWVIGHAAEVTEVTLPYRTGTLPLTVDEAARMVAA